MTTVDDDVAVAPVRRERKPTHVREVNAGCFLCGCNCGLTLRMDENDRIVRVVGDKENLHSKGFLCNKGLNVATSVDSPNRLRHPLRRIGDRYERVSWDEALDDIGDRLEMIRSRHGARAIGLALGGSAHTTIQVMLAFQSIRALGTRNVYGPPGLELNSKYFVNQRIYGASQFDGYPDYDNARYIIVMGSNPVISWPLHTKALREAGKSPDRTLVVVDPRCTETAQLADVHCSIRPTTDVYLLLALLQVITSERLYRDELVSEHATGLDAVERSVARFTPEAVELVTGIEAETIRDIARGFGTADTGVLYYDMGVIANHHSTLLSWASQTLNFITGRMGATGGSIVTPTLIDMNASEARAFGGARYKSRVQPWSEIAGFMPVTILQDEILAPGEGQIRAMIVDGCNPLRGYTNSDKMEQAFDQLDLLVSIDPFLTEVGRKAHYVLPSCAFHEQDSISFGFHCLYDKPFVQLSRKIREPLGESRPEWMIYRDLRRRVGVSGFQNHLMQAVLAGGRALHSLRRREGEFDEQEAMLRIIARTAGTSWKELEAHPHGVVLERDYDFLDSIRTADKRAHLGDGELLAGVDRLGLEIPEADPEFPLTLSTTARTLATINTIFQNVRWQEKHGVHENPVVIHPDDGEAAGLADGDRARLVSRASQGEVAVAFSEDVRPGSAFLSHGWGLIERDPDSQDSQGGVAAAKFLPDDVGDEYTGLPLFSGVPCRIEKL